MSNQEDENEPRSQGLLDRFGKALRLLRIRERRDMGEISRSEYREEQEKITDEAGVPPITDKPQE